MSISAKWVVRGSVYLLLAACSQPLLETYGCACAGRSYTADEIASYRTGAARNDLASLAEMQAYHGWRKLEHSSDSEAYAAEEHLEQNYFSKRLALNDPAAIENEVGRLWHEVVFDDVERPIEQLRRAQSLLARYSGRMALFDFRTRQDVSAADLLNNELLLARQQGTRYSAQLKIQLNQALSGQSQSGALVELR